jgi:hypothetical protein
VPKHLLPYCRSFSIISILSLTPILKAPGNHGAGRQFGKSGSSSGPVDRSGLGFRWLATAGCGANSAPILQYRPSRRIRLAPRRYVCATRFRRVLSGRHRGGSAARGTLENTEQGNTAVGSGSFCGARRLAPESPPRSDRMDPVDRAALCMERQTPGSPIRAHHLRAVRWLPGW